jgi:hypothetical protein
VADGRREERCIEGRVEMKAGAAERVLRRTVNDPRPRGDEPKVGVAPEGGKKGPGDPRGSGNPSLLLAFGV